MESNFIVCSYVNVLCHHYILCLSFPDTAVQIYHAGGRALSEYKVNFREKIIIRGSSLPLLTKIHGKKK